MALDDDGQRPLRLRDDDDDDVDGAAPLMPASSKAGYDGDLGQPRPPVACYRRYAVWIASLTCLVVVAGLLAGGAIYIASIPEPGYVTILISIDGMRPDYLTRGVSPNLLRLAETGVQATAMTAAFATKTFPNHYTLVTGLHPESHGIVSNVFYDPVLDDTFYYTDITSAGQAKWWGGEPIWNTVMKAGKLAACCFWPGSEAPIQGMRPTYYLEYDGSIPNDERITILVRWLNLPAEERPSFITLYFSSVDSAGHSFGPTSNQVNAALEEADAAIGYLMGNLSALGIIDRTNVVIVSDHGMTPTNQRERVVYLDNYINLTMVDIVEYSPVAAIWPKPGQTETVFAALQAGAIANGNFWAYRTDGADADKPKDYWHYSNNVRIAPVLAVAKLGWTLARINGSVSTLLGNHGFDNADDDMNGIFIASGPNVTAGGAILTQFHAVEVYNYLSALSGVTPVGNNGTANATLLREGLRTPPAWAVPALT